MRLIATALVCGVLSVGMFAPARVAADPFEAPPLEPRFWVDSVLGYAIDGYDPMAYHIGGQPLAGKGDHEVRWAGLVWRFANAANLEMFLLTPLVYAPRFGGYDAVGVARGRLAVGDPNIFVLHDGRLYLFHSEIHRIMFLSQPDQFLASATEAWRELEADVPMAIGLP